LPASEARIFQQRSGRARLILEKSQGSEPKRGLHVIGLTCSKLRQQALRLTHDCFLPAGGNFEFLLVPGGLRRSLQQPTILEPVQRRQSGPDRNPGILFKAIRRVAALLNQCEEQDFKRCQGSFGHK
jgi:hypothetical protein